VCLRLETVSVCVVHGVVLPWSDGAYFRLESEAVLSSDSVSDLAVLMAACVRHVLALQVHLPLNKRGQPSF